MLLHLWFPLIWYATWPCSEKVEFWSPGSGGGERGSASKIFTAVLLHSWFPLILYATWPCHEKVEFQPFYPTPRVQGTGLQTKYLRHVEVFVIPFNLICNMTMFWKSKIILWGRHFSPCLSLVHPRKCVPTWLKYFDWGEKHPLKQTKLA